MADLRVDNLHLRLGGHEILKGVSLTLRRGEVTALLGPSGSGKTTLLRAVAGLETPYAGRIDVSGTCVFDGQPSINRPSINRPTEQRGLGFVFQSYALWPHRTVAQNVEYSLILRKIAPEQRQKSVHKALESLGLGHLGHRYPHELSGGQQQRVAIARALVYEPSVVLLDEPLSNLDAKLREEARAFLKELIERENLAALMVTHDQSEALAIANQILLLNGGVVEQEGTPEHLYNAPRSLFAAEFMGSNNRLEGQITGLRDGLADIQIGPWLLQGVAHASCQSGQRGQAIIRLENIELVPQAGPNTITLDLVTSMFLGHVWEHLLRSGEVTVRVHHSAPLAAGRYHLSLPCHKLWVF